VSESSAKVATDSTDSDNCYSHCLFTSIPDICTNVSQFASHRSVAAVCHAHQPAVHSSLPSGAEVASNSGDATSFVLGSKLDYDSAYMWQVNAMMGSNVLSESGTSTFRTMSKPTAPPEIPETVINFPEPVTGTPTWVWVVIALAAILIIVVIVLIFRTRRV
jgi:hypothetical protein